MLHYILQTIAFQLFFLIIYDVFLKKETFFNWNRFYLLITAILSVVLPFIKFESIRTIVPEQFVIRLPEVIIGELQPAATISQIEMPLELISSSNFIWSWDYLLYAGMMLAALLFLYKIIKICSLIQKNPKLWKGNLVIINLLKSNAAFSFFNYVFLGEWIKEEEKEVILKHELVHVSQNHSLDLLLFEVLRILFWFNPLIYMYQNRITILHEYIADAQAMKQTNKKHYYEKLLSQAFSTEAFSFTNTFFNQSLIKKRIVMLGKSKSRQAHLLKYTLLIPMIFGMLVYTSCQLEPKEAENNDVNQYAHTLKVPVAMTDDQKKVHEKYELFLRNNPDYVAWAEINSDKDEVRYSIHSKGEKVPDGFTRFEVPSSNKGEYVIYINLQVQELIDLNKNRIFSPIDYSDAPEVPFSMVDEVPTLQECNDLASNDEKRQCLSDHISDFVNKNFNVKLGKELGLKGKQRISVMFRIGKDGNVKDIMARAPHPALEAEAKRIIGMLPQMVPGKHRGEAVVVPYSLPILFQINE